MIAWVGPLPFSVVLVITFAIFIAICFLTDHGDVDQ